MTELIDFLHQHVIFFYAAIAILGLCIGSFLNVVIYRMPKIMEQEWRDDCHCLLHPDQPLPDTATLTLSRPASTCPHCQHTIRWFENIPLISWLALHGRCSHCGKRISIRYPLVELITMGVSLAVALRFGITPETVYGLIFSWILIALTGIDMDTQYLPDRLTFPLLGLGLAINSAAVFVSPVGAIWGALLGFLSLWTVSFIFKLVTGKVGMGHGDFKLLAALGAWLGVMQLPLIILLSSVVGAILGVVLLIKHKASRHFAFGPFLAIAGWIAFMWGHQIVAFYLSS